MDMKEEESDEISEPNLNNYFRRERRSAENNNTYRLSGSL